MVLQRLRDETRALHDQVERDLEGLRMYASMEDYRVLVARFFGFYGPWEPQVAQILGDPSLPPFATAAEAMGSLYVLEGSTLGAQVISRRLERLLGLRDGYGYAFFRSYGREVSPMWRRFGERLATVSRPSTEEASIRSAQLTFARLHRWLCHGE